MTETLLGKSWENVGRKKKDHLYNTDHNTALFVEEEVGGVGGGGRYINRCRYCVI